jgi:hypothetical protein
VGIEELNHRMEEIHSMREQLLSEKKWHRTRCSRCLTPLCLWKNHSCARKQSHAKFLTLLTGFRSFLECNELGKSLTIVWRSWVKTLRALLRFAFVSLCQAPNRSSHPLIKLFRRSRRVAVLSCPEPWWSNNWQRISTDTFLGKYIAILWKISIRNSNND